ncbi:hypothetical protein IS481_08515 [Caldimonas thermodepolymerans]|jgi:hypothetical protein|uniref:Uncharacterized protein n=1 Tax=Caldimonas thermodepolymerans TaxID=215580 RepID=A0A2S5SZR0_9BURK|nr:hypothetical protein [Caldimonas thermodepolymerans]PPE68255.1 hypothetical protein C1702_18080 [Caldimonas thermodepolymerans]QPC33168.1 hypothetical protein IS481_08515 [Caldimonas thermodepolymerans]RDH94702.1 hypothetical protein DES46_1204 [Caldimonas thermodepolymerans]
MNFAQGMSWLQANAEYRRRFGSNVPDWVCVLEMGRKLARKLALVRATCRIGMPLAASVLVRDEANDPTSLWG